MWITQKTTCQFGRRAQLRAENLSILPSVDPYADLMHCSFRFTNLPDFALDRLSRYEATLWRQAGQSCSLSMHWIVANHKIEGAVSVSVTGKTCRPMDADDY